MPDFGQQPLIVEVRQRMFRHLYDASAAQCAVVALTLHLPMPAAQAFQCPAAELVALNRLWLRACSEWGRGVALEQFTDHRPVYGSRRIAVKRQEQRLLRETQAVVRQHQHMAVALMFEVIVNAFFFAESLQEGQVRFIKLNAQRPGGIAPVRQFKAVAVFRQAVFFEQLAQDGGHIELMKYPACTLSIEVLQPGTNASR